MPVTGILSTVAVLAAVFNERDAVVISSEWLSSVPALEHNGCPVNHQYRVALGIPVAGGPGLWLAEVDLRCVLWVTGAKGKSTTLSVAGSPAGRLGLPVHGLREQRRLAL